MASGAGTADAAVGQARRGRNTAPVEPIAAPRRGSTAEHVVARMHASARRLVLPGLAVVAVCAVTGFLTGSLPEPWQNTALPVAALVIVLIVGLLPFLAWLGRVYVITTRRLVIRSGLLVRARQEILLTRGFEVTVRRTPLQALAGCGNVVVDTGGEEPTVLRDVPSALLVQSALADLMEHSTVAQGTQRQQKIAATRRPFDP